MNRVGRIGVATRIHAFIDYREFEWGSWAVSRCGWAGLAELVQEGVRITCAVCKRGVI